ncbi:MAG: DUF1446 domain-containing protein, partial [Gemmataceae bacterium]|nr:DUF1446 domain-containing protein [Gemmataceae bacterium]
MKRVRIGNGGGFWGDSLDAPVRLVREGRLDYLTLDYLAELTMSILAVQKQKNPALGYATDFLEVARSLIPYLRSQPQLKIITNAGGLNPKGCALAVRELFRQENLADVPIAVVGGDDLLPYLDELFA